MRSKTLRLLLVTACLAVAFWTPEASLGWETCPPASCSSMRDQCENTGGQFTQTYITICDHNGSIRPAFEGICEYDNQGPWGDACYGV